MGRPQLHLASSSPRRREILDVLGISFSFQGVDIDDVEVSSATGPFGIRGVGEPPIIPTLATIANAVHSAAGIRLKELPMTPEVLFWALRAPEHS